MASVGSPYRGSPAMQNYNHELVQGESIWWFNFATYCWICMLGKAPWWAFRSLGYPTHVEIPRWERAGCLAELERLREEREEMNRGILRDEEEKAQIKKVRNSHAVEPLPQRSLLLRDGGRAQRPHGKQSNCAVVMVSLYFSLCLCDCCGATGLARNWINSMPAWRGSRTTLTNWSRHAQSLTQPSRRVRGPT